MKEAKDARRGGFFGCWSLYFLFQHQLSSFSVSYQIREDMRKSKDEELAGVSKFSNHGPELE